MYANAPQVLDCDAIRKSKLGVDLHTQFKKRIPFLVNTRKHLGAKIEISIVSLVETRRSLKIRPDKAIVEPFLQVDIQQFRVVRFKK